MNQLVLISSPTLPALVAAAGERASMRLLEFFAANIRNPHTRPAYYRASQEFLAWCASVGLSSIATVEPVHVAAWIEAGTRELAAPSVKQRLAAIATCSTGSLPARSYRSTRPDRCAGRAMSSRRDKRRCSILPKPARCLTASMCRRTPARATAP